MIRNLKVLLAAAMALAAFGAMSASGAQAAEEFHCSVEPCTFTAGADGTGKTAHHVFIIKKAGVALGSITCNALTGNGTSNTKTTATLTLKGISYGGEGTCSLVGQPATVKMNECDYLFTAAGKVSVKCPAGKAIELIANKCVVTIGEKHEATVVNQELGTLKYINKGAGATTEVTVEVNVTKVQGIIEPTVDCENLLGKGNTGTFTEGEYTTGNTTVTAETHAGVMAEGWWA